MATLRSSDDSGAAVEAASSTSGSRSRSPGVQKAWIPGTDRTKATLRSSSLWVTYGSYQVADVCSRSFQGRAAPALIAITPSLRADASSKRASAERR